MVSMKIALADIPDRIAAIQKLSLSHWEADFAKGIQKIWDKHRYLTVGQYDILTKIEERNTPAAVKERLDWVANWDEEHAQKFHRAMRYYKNTVYFPGIVKAYNENPEYIPSKAEYQKICENSYMKRMFAYDAQPAKFSVGSLVVSKGYMGTYLLTVLEVGEHSTPARGSRFYKTVNVLSGKIHMLGENALLPATEANAVGIVEYDEFF